MSLQTNVERFPVRPAEEASRAPAERRRRSEEKISIGVTEQGNGSDGHERSYVLKAPLNGKIPCSNPRCTHGGFELQPIIDEMRTEGERRQLVVEWSGASTPVPSRPAVHQLFTERAARAPLAR